MRIEILNRELKNNKLEIGALDVAYMLSIRNSEPEIFNQLKSFIDYIDKKE